MTKKSTAIALLNKKTRTLKTDIEENTDKKMTYLEKSIVSKKAIHKRSHKDRKHRELSLRVNALMSSNTGIKNTINGLKQIISHIKVVKDQVKFKFKRLKKIRKIPIENPFDFTEHVEKQKGGNEIELGLVFELAGRKTRLCTIKHQ